MNSSKETKQSILDDKLLKIRGCMKAIKRIKEIRDVEDIPRRPNIHIFGFPEGDSRVKKKINN